MALRSTYPTFIEAMRAIASVWNNAFNDTRMTKGVDSIDDLISTKGIVLQSPNLHYWRATISNTGTVTWTDLGLTKP
jgi:hypothetical protein